ncbi:uncharacterized protein LOC107043098 [Diachasma alloeum]|uniref:uncharacterized protein LOC107043098 n=1 Tax=Diachasma alloeum TaxID=454923 RepID=UPI0007382958|nr:uncharacterized protein LOC107043098 [Diachasma alloeum]
MDENKSKMSPSAQDGATHHKRRKLDDPADPSNRSGTYHSQATNMTLDKRSPPMPEIKTLDQIRAEITNLFDEERRLLKEEIISQKELQKNLALRLAELTKCCHEAKAAQVSAEARMIQLETELDIKMAELADLRQSIQAAQDAAQQNAAVNRISELQEKGKSCSLAQEPASRQPTPQSIVNELDEANLKIRKLESEKIALCEELLDLLPRVERVHELEEKLRSINSADGTPRKVVKSVILSDDDDDEVAPEKCHVASQTCLKDFKRKSSRLLEKQHKGVAQRIAESTKCRQEAKAAQASAEAKMTQLKTKAESDSSSLKLVSSNPAKKTNRRKGRRRANASSSCKSDNGDRNASQTRRIWAGEIPVVPSDPKFFEINWETQCKQRRGKQFSCKRCKYTSKARLAVEDHVWVCHFNGRFGCPLCPDIVTKWRYDTKRHWMEKHHE